MTDEVLRRMLIQFLDIYHHLAPSHWAIRTPSPKGVTSKRWSYLVLTGHNFCFDVGNTSVLRFSSSRNWNVPTTSTTKHASKTFKWAQTITPLWRCSTSCLVGYFRIYLFSHFFPDRYFCYKNNKPKCLARDKMCDGTQQCDDGSDESADVCGSEVPSCDAYQDIGDYSMELSL